MRKLILKMSISLDGFVAGPNGEVGWSFDSTDGAAIAWEVDLLWRAGIHIMGRRTFHDMVAWWPTSTEPYAPPMNEIPKGVFSRRGAVDLASKETTATLGEVARLRAAAGVTPSPDLQKGAESWPEARVFSGNLAEGIARLKQEPGKDILAHGGAGFARSLISSGLVDEYHLLVHPVALGSGLAIFSDLPRPLALTLDSSTRFPAGAMVNVYRPA